MMDCYSFKREIPVEDGYDLVVAGGGPGGCAAALSAARAGARVLLVESLGCLGGMGTNGLVLQWGPFLRNNERVVGGIPLEIYQMLDERGYAFQPRPDPLPVANCVSIDPKGLKLVLDELLAKANVEVRFFTKAVEIDKAPDRFFVNGVMIHNIEGFRYIKAKTFVDATGDASLVKLCGAECFEPDVAMAPTLCAVVDGIEWEKADVDASGKLRGQQEVVNKAVADGFFSQPDRHVPGIFRSFRNLGAMNAGHVFDLNSLNCQSLSDGMVRGRLQVQEYILDGSLENSWDVIAGEEIYECLNEVSTFWIDGTEYTRAANGALGESGYYLIGDAENKKFIFSDKGTLTQG